MRHLTKRANPLTILCLEDEPLQQRLLGACAQLIGAETEFAETGPQAVKVFRTKMIDFVVLNLNTPANGLETLKSIRLSGRRGLNVPVLAVTENIAALPESAYKRLGFTGLYVKPVEPYRLIDRIDAALIASGQPPLFMMRVDG
jgi:CheY-like chemotaxis protein